MLYKYILDTQLYRLNAWHGEKKGFKIFHSFVAESLSRRIVYGCRYFIHNIVVAIHTERNKWMEQRRKIERLTAWKKGENYL